jgi:hypothetical protein
MIYSSHRNSMHCDVEYIRDCMSPSSGVDEWPGHMARSIHIWIILTDLLDSLSAVSGTQLSNMLQHCRSSGEHWNQWPVTASKSIRVKQHILWYRSMYGSASGLQFDRTPSPRYKYNICPGQLSHQPLIMETGSVWHIVCQGPVVHLFTLMPLTN